MHPPLEIIFRAPLACFTRPETKVERVSYPAPTPSGIRGALEAVFWKPEVTWEVREIHVLEPIQYVSILRNEVDRKASERSGPIVAPESRQQRNTLYLRDVAYLVKADLRLRAHATDDIAKYRDMFRRRAAKGQCYQRPYLGCRECAADFHIPDGSEQAIDDTRDLGLMLFDIAFRKVGNAEKNQARFFQARLECGVLRVPAAEYRNLEAIS